MGYEKTPPANKLIIATAVGSSVFLLGLIPFFHSYFNQMVEEEHYAKYIDVPNAQFDAVEEAQSGNLASGSPSIEEAMALVASGQRPALIAPKESGNLAALEGWNKMPNAQALADAQAAAPVEAPAEATEPSTDEAVPAE